MDARPPQPPHDLHYAAASPWHGQRRWRRVIWATAIVALLFTGVIWGPLAWSLLATFQCTRQCLAYSRYPDSIIYDATRSMTDPFAIDVHVSEQAVPLRGPRSGMRYQPMPTVFLHARAKPSGQQRLVCVHLANPSAVGVEFRCESYALPPFGRGFQYVKSNDVWLPSNMPMGAHLRVYAGQADAFDASHFTFDYELNGHRSTVDGWLGNDDTILLAVRQPNTRPATLPVLP
jgi:hypothetical protein